MTKFAPNASDLVVMLWKGISPHWIKSIFTKSFMENKQNAYNQRDVAVETHFAARAAHFLCDRHVVASDHAVDARFELREVWMEAKKQEYACILRRPRRSNRRNWGSIPRCCREARTRPCSRCLSTRWETGSEGKREGKRMCRPCRLSDCEEATGWASRRAAAGLLRGDLQDLLAMSYGATKQRGYASGLGSNANAWSCVVIFVDAAEISSLLSQKLESMLK